MTTPIASVGSVVLLANTIFGILLQDKARSYLYSNLQWGGIAALLIGFLYTVNSSYTAIMKLFPPTEKIDQQTQQRISRMIKVGLSSAQIMEIEQVSESQLKNVVAGNKAEIVGNEPTETDQRPLSEN